MFGYVLWVSEETPAQKSQESTTTRHKRVTTSQTFFNKLQADHQDTGLGVLGSGK